MNITQSVGTVGSIPQNYKCRIGYTSEFVTAFAVNSTTLTAEQLAETEQTFTVSDLSESGLQIQLFDLPTEFVTDYVNGEYEFDGNVMYIEFVPIDGSVSESNKIYFAFDFTKGITSVEISAPVVF